MSDSMASFSRSSCWEDRTAVMGKRSESLEVFLDRCAVGTRRIDHRVEQQEVVEDGIAAGDGIDRRPVRRIANECCNAPTTLVGLPAHICIELRARGLRI